MPAREVGDMRRVGGPLQELLERLRLTGQMRGWEAVELWPEVAGDRIAARTRATEFRDGVLTVSVDNAVWMNELTYLRHRIVEELNRRLGGRIVTEIRLQPARDGGRPDRNKHSS